MSPGVSLSLHDVIERNSMLEPKSGCVLWTGRIGTHGYGLLHYAGQPLTAHRAAWAARHGPIPQGKHVLHKCDVKACVNPDHLFLGTHLDNMRDMFAKGLRKTKAPLGEKCHFAKLDESRVRAIRADSGTMVSLGRKYGVSPSLVSMIRRGAVWKHVQ